MCQAAGGRAYQANSVAALQHVLVDSVAHPPAVPHPAGQ
jgi:hypothetical protein